MIFIVIPVFNRKVFTRSCLKSLAQQTFKDFTVIIVDDGSTDGTSEMIQADFPAVHLLKGDGNLWWAGATNKGIEYVFNHLNYTDQDFILTLNNDLEVAENYLQVLVCHAATNSKAVIGSVSVDISNLDRMDYCGVAWNEFTGRHFLKIKAFNCSYKELVSRKQIIESDTLTGRGTLFPIRVFKEIGLYDSINFPQYAADEDFSLRARKKGWQLLIPTETYLKSHINETGADVVNVQANYAYFKHLFFSIKSPLNLKIRYRWAMKNTKLKILYFLMDSSKNVLSFSFKALKKALR